MSQAFTMSVNSSQPPAAAPPVVAVLLPIIAGGFIAFLLIGLALPVLPLDVHQDLGLGTLVVGLVAGAQFAASLLSRFWAGNYGDSRGAKRALVTGLLVAAVAGLLYLLSLRFVSEPETSVTILLLGRAVLGVAESFIVTGAFTWGLSLVGPQNTGKIMAWVGTAMYAAFAVGAPAGTTLYAGYGFAAIALATTLIPLGALLLVAPRRPVAPPTHARPAFTRVVGSVWVPGLGLALSSVGFGAITTFIVLLFAQHGWGQAWLAFTVLSIAFMAGGPVFRHPPRRIGGARGALGFVLVATGGQARAWFAPWSAPAVVCEPVAARRVLLAYPQLLRGA